MVQEKLKKKKSISFIIVFYCSMVTIGKNAKKNSKKIFFFGSSHTKVYGKKSWRSYSSGILTLLTSLSLDFYSKMTDGSVVNAHYPNGCIQLD